MAPESKSSSEVPSKRLKFKGAAEKALRKKKKRLRADPGAEPEQLSAASPPRHSAPPEECAASGRLVTSGVTVHGLETKFKEELQVGDTLLVFHPKLLVTEERVVVGILSQRSLTIHTPFSEDILSTTAFRIRKDSALLAEEAAETLRQQPKEDKTSGGEESTLSRSVLQDAISRHLQKKLKSARPILTYREKTGMWGYRTVTEQVPAGMTAEEVLDMRSKKQGRDKYCW